MKHIFVAVLVLSLGATAGFGFDAGAKASTSISVSTGLSYSLGSGAPSLMDLQNGLSGGTYGLTWDLSREDSGLRMEVAIPAVGITSSAPTKLLSAGYGWMILDQTVKILSGITDGSPWAGLDDFGGSFVTSEKGTLQVQFFPKDKFHFGATYQFPIVPGSAVLSDFITGTAGTFPDLFSYALQADWQQAVGFHQGSVSVALLGLGDWRIRSGANWLNREVEDGNRWICDASIGYQLDPKVAITASGNLNINGPKVGDLLTYSVKLYAGLPLDQNWFWGAGAVWNEGMADPSSRLMSQKLANAIVGTDLGYVLEAGTSLTLNYSFTFSSGEKVFYFGTEWYRNDIALDARWSY